MLYNLILSLIYSSALCWVYSVEILHYWSYLNYNGQYSLVVFLQIVVLTAILVWFLPVTRSTRSYIVLVAHYFYFIPSIVYVSFNEVNLEYKIGLTISAIFIYLLSGIPMRNIATNGLRRSNALIVFVLGTFVALVLQASFGGLQYFSLSLEDVYLYRSKLGASMPGIFAYLYSNISNVIIPASIVMAMRLNSRLLLLFGLVSGVLLFAMSQHKAVLFTTLFVTAVYFILIRIRHVSFLAILPLSMVAISVAEVFYFTSIADNRNLGLLTSYLVRRPLLVPPMLESAYFDFFSENAKYYWSSSRFGLGIASSQYDVSAPFMIGTVLFNDPQTSSNVGAVGSGYAHAGLIGVTVYSAILGWLIAYLNAVGRKVGDEVTAAISVPTFLMVLTTTDIATAFLTHGLLLLLLLVSFMPREEISRARAL